MNSVLAAALVATGGIAWATVAAGSSSTGTATTRTATVARGTVLATVSGSGTLTSPSDAGVNFATGGTLTEVDVTAGQKVSAGQVLGKVDATSAEETLTNAKAQLSSAEANLTQVEAGTLPAGSNSNGNSNSSSGNGGGSTGGRGGAASTPATPTPSPTPTVNQAQLASAEQQVTSAQNSVAAARRAVDGTVLRAPVAGTVASVSGKVGETVSGTGSSGGGSGSGSGGGSSSGSSSASSSSTLSGFVVITNPAGMEVSADFSESDALKLKAGQGATVTLNADTTQVLNAKVVSISSLPVSSSGTGGGSSSGAVQYAALLAITGDTANLRTGLSASVQVVTGEASGALYLPTSAINGTGANASVQLVQADGTTRRTPITLGVQGDSDDQILSGVTEGQKVQITVVSTGGSNGFPSTGFPGGFGGGGGGGFGGRGGGRSGTGGRG